MMPDLTSKQFDEVYHAEPMSGRGGFLRMGQHFVHVGTRRAALARVHPDNWEAFDDSPASSEYATGRSRLWSASISPTARVGPSITDTKASEGVVPKGDFDVYPYKNEYEDPGSQSYMVRASALKRARPIGSGPGRIRAMIGHA